MTYNVNESLIHKQARHTSRQGALIVEEPLTAEALHHLGWLWANVRFCKKKGYGWSATIYLNDVACEEGYHYSREQLQAILEYIGLDNTITANARNRIHIRSVPLARLLIDHYHLPPDKTHTVPAEYAQERAFWGGYIEQNGMPGIHTVHNGIYYWYIDVQGSVQLLEQLHQFIDTINCAHTGVSPIVQGKHLAEISIQNHAADCLTTEIYSTIQPYCNGMFWKYVDLARTAATQRLLS